MSGESDSDRLDRLARSIADGDPIDWDAELATIPPDSPIRRELEFLRLVCEIDNTHRSDVDLSTSNDLSRQTPEPVHPEGSIGEWGKFLLYRKIGEGGFGEVYHAYDPTLEHSVALKLFKPKATNRESANRILHEARKLARIRHPNVVIVHGADSHNGQPGFWMDLIEGTTLEHLVQAGRRSAGEAAYVGQEVCRALAAVHLAGIVHRDVKAQNVMRATDGGRIILMDFGAGELMKDERADVRKQGTPLYLAPELFDGGSGSARSDIYATGVLMYYLVTADFPVRGASIDDLRRAHHRGERRRLRDVRPDLPSQFVSIVECALDPDPAARFSSAGEMENALVRQSVPVSVAVPVEVKSVNRIPLQIAATGAAAAVVWTAIIGWIACRVFDTAVGVHTDLAGGPLDYLYVGATALLPLGILWSVGAGVLLVIGSMGRALRRPINEIRRTIRASWNSPDGATVATFVLAAGIAGWLAICWQYLEVFRVMGSLMLGAPASAPDVSVLGSGGRLLHRAHSLYSAYLSLLLALAVWRWFPLFESNTADPDRVRLLKSATIVVTGLVIATATFQFRLVWERFEVVTFENSAAFVIGSSNDELLLYYPYSDASKHRRVRTDAATLQRTGAQARLFDRQ